jgi:CBS domain-containing membrane protein
MGTFVDCSEADPMHIYHLAPAHARCRVLEYIPVQQAMSREVVSVRASASVAEAEGQLLAHRIGGMPVVDDARRVVGVVSETDFLYKLEDRAFLGIKDRVRQLFGGAAKASRKFHADTVGEIMTALPITVTLDTPLGQVATLFLERGIKRVPVVDADGRPIGIVSRADLVRVLRDRGEQDRQ